MGKQYNKILKRRRRERYIKRKKQREKAARQGIGAVQAEGAKHSSAPAH